MYERPNCIEDLTEQREFVKTVPDLIQANQARIDQVHYHHSLHSFLSLSLFPGEVPSSSFSSTVQVMADYDLLDDYFFTLSDEDFENR